MSLHFNKKFRFRCDIRELFLLSLSHTKPQLNEIFPFCYSNLPFILDYNSYSGVPNGESNHENAGGDGATRGEGRGGRPRRYNNRAPRRSRNSESGGKPAPGEKVNNFEN